MQYNEFLLSSSNVQVCTYLKQLNGLTTETQSFILTAVYIVKCKEKRKCTISTRQLTPHSLTNVELNTRCELVHKYVCSICIHFLHMGNENKRYLMKT